MNNKRIPGLRLGNLLIILGTTFGLLFTVSSQTLSSQSSDPSTSNPNQEAADHINEAKSALQNGDTEGAQRHLDLAHQALGCSPWDPRCASE
ncbi:MAG: hypothetical protein WA461_06635 [Nitrososphaeraceae archaeon]